jgi:glutamine synthetase
VNGYKRYVPNSFAPWNVSWGFENRTTLLRIPLDRGENTRVENRLGEAATNPYLAAAGTIATGLLGLGGDIDAERLVEADAYVRDLPRLPATLDQSLSALESDTDLRAMLGEPFIRLYTAIKRNEIRRSREAVTDWERNEYLELV